jgi:tetratricopeptide (TPR) repeat protein
MAIEEAMPKAEGMAMKALELDNTLAEAHAALGAIHRVFHWDLEESEKQHKLAMELDPSSYDAPYGYAFVLSALRRHDEAIVAIKHAQQLDPLNPLYRLAAALHFMWARRYDEAIEQVQAAQQLYPDIPRVYQRLATVYEATELYDEAAAAWQKWQILLGVSEDEVAGISGAATSGRETYFRWKLTYWNDRAKRENVPMSEFIKSYGYLGEKDQAFEWLEKQYEDRDGTLLFLNIQPHLVFLRDDPRFHDLLLRMNLQP